MVWMLAQPLALMLALMLAHALARVLSSCQHYCRKPRDARGLAAPLARACRPRESAQGGNTDPLHLGLRGRTPGGPLRMISRRSTA